MPTRHAASRTLLLGLLALASCKARESSTVQEGAPRADAGATPYAKYLAQGWDEAARQEFYNTPQGSRFMPYAYFLHLETADGRGLFRDAANMRRFGYVPNGVNGKNPDGLPVGFVKDRDDEAGKDWLGFTCAACHTGVVSRGGKSVIIDGGSTIADHFLFRRELLAALRATRADSSRFARFAAKAAPGRDAQAFAGEFDAFVASYEALTKRSMPSVDYGPARLDAFGIELNEILATGLGIPENHRSADAPVSYPQVWDAPELDWVEWNGSAQGPLIRNMGEVLGVFGHTDFSRAKQGVIKTSIRFDDLYRIEEVMKSLKSPRWPEDVLGALDRTKVAAGKAVYEKEGCGKCHGSVTDMTPPNKFGKSFIKVTMVPVKDVGTDPVFVTSLLTRSSKTGPYEGLVISRPGQPEVKLGAEAPAAIMLRTILNGLMDDFFKQRGLTGEAQLPWINQTDRYRQPPNPAAYKARPLNGIWATAPYLHNGSVASLYELLLPPAQRQKTFHVGGSEFDPKAVGYVTDASAENHYLFDTSVKGNANTGHTWGTNLGEKERWDLVEYLKSL